MHCDWVDTDLEGLLLQTAHELRGLPLWLESWVPLLVLISITSRRHGQGNEGDEGEGGRRGTCARSKAHEEGHEGHEGEGHEGEEVRVVRR